MDSKAKARQTWIDLDTARCNENWANIPELAKRYKKYHPYESVLEFTARLEAEFVQLIRQIRHGKYNNESDSQDPSTSETDNDDNITTPAATTSGSRKWGNRQLINPIVPSTPSSINVANNSTAKRMIYTEEPDICYQLDDPNHISISPVVQPSQAQLILVRLLDIIQRQIKAGEALETPDDWQAQFSKIVLARIYFETGRYEKAVEWLQQLALRLEDVESGYGLVLLIQARVIKGICFELQDNLGDALEAYSSALQSAEQHPEEKNKALWFWLEDCLYRSILLQLRKKGSVKQTLTLMRTYLHYCQTQWPADWRIHKRWIIFRHYIRYLTKAYQKDVYVPASFNDDDSTTLQSSNKMDTLFDRSAAALDETTALLNQFRYLLLTSFVPHLQKSNQTDLHHRTLELSNLLVLAHDTVGWGTDESYLRRLAKFYYRTQKLVMTESVCISRHLFYVLLRLGELKEAKAAFTRYLEMLGVKDCQWGVISLGNKDNDDSDDDSNDMDDVVEILQTKLASIVQTSLTSANQNLSNLERIHTPDDDSEIGIARKAPTGSFENDTEFEVVKLLLAAAQQLYGQLEGRGQEASALSDLATVILEESEHLKKKRANQWRSLMVQSRRTTGIAYGLYASQCQDRKQRSRCLSESLIALKRASELDTRSWQTFYELGLQQSIVGDLASAISSIKRSIKLRNDFIPSWHLLALIQSSRQLHALPSSLELIQQVHDYKLHQELYSDPDPLDTEEGQAFFERAESYIKLQMTQIKILEALEGPEAILKTYPGILDTYAALSRKMKFSHFLDDETTIVKAGRRKSSSFGGRDASSIISFASRPRSFSVLSKPTSLGEEDEESQNSTPHQSQTSTLAVVNEDCKDTEQEQSQEEVSYFTMLQNRMEEDANEDGQRHQHHGKKSRKSAFITRQLMDDPLLSFPSSSSSTNTRKKKESNNKRKSHFLSLKTPFRNGNSSSPQIDTLPLNNNTTSKGFKSDQQDDSENHSLRSAHMSTVQAIDANSSPKGSSSTIFSSRTSSSQEDHHVSNSSVKHSITEKKKSVYHCQREARWCSLLVQIWIMISDTYRLTEQFEEAIKALLEADQLTKGQNADVWHRIGLILLSKPQESEITAVDAFNKALSIDSDHVATQISLGSFYVNTQQFDLAEELLKNATQGLGWNQPEAWYLLGQIYREQGNVQDAKDFLLYALKLSDMNPIVHPIDQLLPRFV